MNILIIGSTRSALVRAVEWQEAGHHVRIVTTEAYIGEDMLSTFRASVCEEDRTFIRGFTGMDCLSPVEMKRALIMRLDQANVALELYTSFVAPLLSHKQVCGALLAGPNGLKSISCHVIVDATMLGEPTFQAAGVPLLLPAGQEIILRTVLVGEQRDTFPNVPKGVSLCRDPKDPDRVHLAQTLTLSSVMTPTQARCFVLDARARLLRKVLNASWHSDSAQPQVLETTLKPPALSLPGFIRLGTELPMTSPSELPDEVVLDGCVLPYNQQEGLSAAHLRCLPQKNTDVMICGGGTAGLWSALYAARTGARVLCTERYGLMGGTRTLGGVSGLYCGNRSGLFQSMWDEMTDYACSFPGQKRIDPVLESLFANNVLQKGKVEQLLKTSIVFAEVQNNRISCLLAAGTDGLFCIHAKQYVDATGEGLLCFMAGCGGEIGDSALHMTQNFSQWNRCTFSQRAFKSVDQGVLEATRDDEWQRALRENLTNAQEYDLFEQLTPRESRRILGRKKLTLHGIACGRRWPDTVYDAYSTFDPHGRSFSFEGRLGALPALGKGRFAAIPLGALLPERLDGVLVTGKAISCTQEAMNFIRMNPDIMSIGAIAGRLAGEAAMAMTDADQLPLADLQSDMLDLGAMIAPAVNLVQDSVTANTIAARILAAEDDSALNDAILAHPDGLDTLLSRARNNQSCSRTDWIDFLLLLYGDLSVADRMCAELSRLNEKWGAGCYFDRQRDTGVILGGVHGEADDYWQINRILVLLCHYQWRKTVPIVQKILKNTVAGGEWRNPTSPYSSIRLDTNTLPNYDRILCLAHAIEEMPDPCYKPQLRRIFEEIVPITPPRSGAWRDYLLLRIALAYQACDGNGVELLNQGKVDENSALVKNGRKLLNAQT